MRAMFAGGIGGRRDPFVIRLARIGHIVVRRVGAVNPIVGESPGGLQEAAAFCKPSA